MKRYDDLTEEQQQAAREKALQKLIAAILEGVIRFNDKLNGDDLQATIDAACEQANSMKTPWFAHEYVLEARYTPMDGHITEPDGKWPVREHLESMALCDAEDAYYPEPGTAVIAGIA